MSRKSNNKNRRQRKKSPSMPLLPRILKKDAINEQQAAKLVDGKLGRRGQGNGLIYSASQMHNALSNNKIGILCLSCSKQEQLTKVRAI